jgi:hypothetical protein
MVPISIVKCETWESCVRYPMPRYENCELSTCVVCAYGKWAGTNLSASLSRGGNVTPRWVIRKYEL